MPLDVQLQSGLRLEGPAAVGLLARAAAQAVPLEVQLQSGLRLEGLVAAELLALEAVRPLVPLDVLLQSGLRRVALAAAGLLAHERALLVCRKRLLTSVRLGATQLAANRAAFEGLDYGLPRLLLDRRAQLAWERVEHGGGGQHSLAWRRSASRRVHSGSGSGSVALAPGSALRARAADRRAERRARSRQAARHAARLVGWCAGEAGLGARGNWAALGAVRGRGGAVRGVRMGPGVQAQGGGGGGGGAEWQVAARPRLSPCVWCFAR